MAIDSNVLEKAKKWTLPPFDEQTREETQYLIDHNPDALINAFYKDLEFGTGGIRGVMGVGTNQMNRYTVGMSTQGLANYLLETYPDSEIKVAISYDCRNNNTFFAQTAADVLTANGIHVYLFDGLRPTPELSFAIRYLNCDSGIMITASHNPKEYNGYKVYWNDGAQIIAPHDKNIVAEVKKITDVSQVKFDGDAALLHFIGEEIDKAYIEKVLSLSLAPDVIKNNPIKIVYTPIHGTGVKLVPMAMKAFGFSQIFHVPAQEVNDGNFPTVISPNPEESEALTMALEKAHEVDADLILATDPDADRVGIAIKNNKNEFVLLNGNQTAAILFYYILKQYYLKELLTGQEFVVKTVVTSDVLTRIAEHFNVKCDDTLTGFKWIAQKIREYEGQEKYICGGEESYGYLIGDFVRDKDAVSSCCLIAEAVAWASSQGKTAYQLLADIYSQMGFYHERLLSVTRKGKLGSEEISNWMDAYRNNPPKQLLDEAIVEVRDYNSGQVYFPEKQMYEKMPYPSSNVIQWLTNKGTLVTMRPSGTEPKIKYYFSVNTTLLCEKDMEQEKSLLDRKIDAIIDQMNIPL